MHVMHCFFPASLQLMTADQKVKSERREKFFKEMAQLKKKETNYEQDIKELSEKKGKLTSEIDTLKEEESVRNQNKQRGKRSKRSLLSYHSSFSLLSIQTLRTKVEVVTGKLTNVDPAISGRMSSILGLIQSFKEKQDSMEEMRARMYTEVDMVQEVRRCGCKRIRQRTVVSS